jgi:serine/threonine-protein kinase
MPSLPRLLFTPSVHSGACLVAVFSFCAPSVAQSPAPVEASDREAQAQAAFEAAQSAAASGDLAAACEQYQKSFDLAPGLGVTLYLADCLEKLTDLAGALTFFERAAELAAQRGDAREQVAREQIAKLEALVPRLTLTVTDPPPGLEVLVDDEAVGMEALTASLRLNAGAHRVVARAPGRASFTQEVALKEGEEQTLSITLPPVRAGADNTQKDATPEKSGLGTRKLVAFTLGGAGVVGLGLGVYFGLQARSNYNDSNSDGHCDSNDFCDSAGLALRDDAQSSATLGTISVAAGVALLGAGAYLYFTDKSKQEGAWLLAPGVSHTQATLHAQRTF